MYPWLISVAMACCRSITIRQISFRPPVALQLCLLFNGPAGFKEHRYEKISDQSNHLRGIDNPGCVSLLADIARRERSSQVWGRP